MKTVLKGLTAAVLLSGVAAVSAEAQQRSWGFGLHGSYLRPGSLAEAEPSDNDLKLDDGWTIGGGLEGWFGSRRWGLRLDGAYSNEPYVMTVGEGDPFDDGDFDQDGNLVLQSIDVDTWYADADLMLRLLPTEVDRRFAPFISLGTGLIHWRNQLDDEFDGNDGVENDDVGNITFQPADAFLEAGNHTEWALTGSLGTDIFFTEAVALRLEAKDYWNSDSPWLVLSDLDRDHEGGHNVMFRAGLQFNFGGARVEEPGFIAEAPEPEPEPEPEVVEPATERITMCVVDESGRLQTVDAIRYIETRQIYVMRNGQEVAFSTVYPVVEPTYIRSADWYVARRPLVLDLGDDDMGGDIDDEIDDAIEDLDDMPDNRVEFVTFGSTAPVRSSDIMYVGTIDGTPLYARTTDVGSLRTDLETRLRTTTDLDDILEDEDFANRFANEIETFYLAVEPAENECVFQPVSSTRVVQRTRG